VYTRRHCHCTPRVHGRVHGRVHPVYTRVHAPPLPRVREPGNRKFSSAGTCKKYRRTIDSGIASNRKIMKNMTYRAKHWERKYVPIARFTRATPRFASAASHQHGPTMNMQKSVWQNLIMGQSYGPRRIFLVAFSISRFCENGHILGKTLCSGPRRRPGRHVHRSTGLARPHHVRCP
jgi:hypothetical protein